MSAHPPIVILTARELDYKAVRDRLSGIREPPGASGTRFEVGSLGAGEVVLAVSGEGTQGAAALAERVIRVFAPRAVFFVGMAEALKPGVRPGDVVVATRVYADRPGKWVWQMDHGLERTARRIARHREGGPRIHVGAVTASGMGEPDALAIETDYAAVAKAGAVPAAVIRAISCGNEASAADFALALASDLIARQPPAGKEPREAPDIRMKSKGARPGVVAGLIGGGVRNQNKRPGWSSGPGREERGRR